MQNEQVLIVVQAVLGLPEPAELAEVTFLVEDTAAVTRSMSRSVGARVRTGCFKALPMPVFSTVDG